MPLDMAGLRVGDGLLDIGVVGHAFELVVPEIVDDAVDRIVDALVEDRRTDTDPDLLGK